MSVKRLLVLVNLVIVVILGLILTVFLVHNNKTQSSVQEMIHVDQALLLNLNEMYTQGLQTEQATRNVVLNPDDTKAKANYKKANEDFLKANEDGLKLAIGKTREGLMAVKLLWSEDNDIKMQVQDIASARKREESIKLLNQKETPKWRDIKDLLLRMTKEQTNVFKTRLDESGRQSKQSTLILVAVIVSSIIGITVFLYIIRRTAEKTMTNALECFSVIEKGDLQEEHAITEDCNFLKESFNKILLTLRSTIKKVTDVSHRVTQNVDSLAEKMNVLDRTAKDQLSQVDHIASSATEISQTIVDSARNASNASEMAREATSIADKGKSTVRKTVDAIVAISDSVRESSHTIVGGGRKEPIPAAPVLFCRG